MDDIPTHTAASIDVDGLFLLKREAVELQRQATANGSQLKRAAALEQVARSHGFKDWNAAAAAAAHSNSAKLASATQPTKPRFAFDAIDAPLPHRPLRLYQAGDLAEERVMNASSELYRWAQQLEFIATKIEPVDRRAALSLIGGNQPYAFVSEPSRWTDGMFRLCDRGYGPIKGLTFTKHELEELGIVEWNDRFGSHDGRNAYSVVNDDVVGSRNDELLRRAARLLISISQAVDVKHFGPALAVREAG